MKKTIERTPNIRDILIESCGKSSWKIRIILIIKRKQKYNRKSPCERVKTNSKSGDAWSRLSNISRAFEIRKFDVQIQKLP